jgi:hypothetical protein
VQSLDFTFLPLWNGTPPRLTLSESGDIQAVSPAPRQTGYLENAGDAEIGFAMGARS